MRRGRQHATLRHWLYRKHKSNCSIYTKKIIHQFVLYAIYIWDYCLGFHTQPKIKQTFQCRKEDHLVTGKNFSRSLRLVFELDHILNKTFLLNFMSKSIPSKPLFIKNKILNLKNLYLYHCVNEKFKIFKFRSPIVVHNL